MSSNGKDTELETLREILRLAMTLTAGRKLPALGLLHGFACRGLSEEGVEEADLFERTFTICRERELSILR